jgi:hypothetical protein
MGYIKCFEPDIWAIERNWKGCRNLPDRIRVHSLTNSDKDNDLINLIIHQQCELLFLFKG